MTTSQEVLTKIISAGSDSIIDDWVEEINRTTRRREERGTRAEMQHQCREFLSLFETALPRASSRDFDDLAADVWTPMRDLVSNISRSRAKQGFTPSETATFVFALKRPLLARLRTELAADPESFAQASWQLDTLLDQFGVFTMEAFLRSREEVINRQQQELLELSTPVVQLWQGVLALPMIGTLDSARTQIVMESLLEKIVETGSSIAILDITGVPTVDTLVAQHLLKTIAAARLMGAECIISGIRPQIAQTIVHLGVDLADVTTKATLADAFRVALAKLNTSID